VRRNLGYKELAEQLAEIGVKETERNLSNKVNRGTFMVVILLQVMGYLASKIFNSTAGIDP
jgi:Domain of unknown function (DUF6471)